MESNLEQDQIGKRTMATKDDEGDSEAARDVEGFQIDTDTSGSLAAAPQGGAVETQSEEQRSLKGGRPLCEAQAKVSYSEALVEGSAQSVAEPVFVVKDGIAEVALEGFPSKEVTEKSSTEIVTKLMEELESMSGKESLSGSLVNVGKDLAVSDDFVDVPSGLVSNQRRISPTHSKDKSGSNCLSPNGFQALQDIREEGEIEDEEMEEEGKNLEEEIYADDITKKTSVVVHSQGTTQRSRGKNLRRAIVVASVWNESAPLYHSRSALKFFQEKLKSLKSVLRGLNRDMFGDLPGRVKQAYDDLCAKQNEAMQDPQTATFEAASDAWEHWHHISGIEEQFFFQKSRVQWLGLGDRNSRFFHKVAQSRNVRNTIRRIVTADGRILTSLPDIKSEAVSHFASFLNGSDSDHQ
ncbi:hypothetical protein HID58_025895, partial [Brassica napus]